MVSSPSPPIPNLFRRESDAGPSRTTSRSLAPGPPLTAPEPRVTPRSVAHGAPGPQAPDAPTRERMHGRSRTTQPGDPDDLGPTLRHGQGRCRKLSHPATPGGRRARPVGGLPTPASTRASKNETATSWSREEPSKRSHSGPDTGLPTGSLPARGLSAHATKPVRA